ncbi:hypothetical protein F4778DRAFT_738009, partial [Xylariomycetidae sp. FL2044]
MLPSPHSSSVLFFLVSLQGFFVLAMDGLSSSPLPPAYLRASNNTRVSGSINRLGLKWIFTFSPIAASELSETGQGRRPDWDGSRLGAEGGREAGRKKGKGDFRSTTEFGSRAAQGARSRHTCLPPGNNVDN